MWKAVTARVSVTDVFKYGSRLLVWMYMITSGTVGSGATAYSTRAQQHVLCLCNYHKIYLLEPILNKHVLLIIIYLTDLRSLWSLFQYVSVKMSEFVNPQVELSQLAGPEIKCNCLLSLCALHPCTYAVSPCFRHD